MSHAVTAPAVPLKIQAARQLISQAWPYLAQAAFRLTFRPVDHPRVTSLAVDRYWRCYYNPAWVEGASPGLLAVAIAGHELLHLLYDHFARGEPDNPVKNNVCGDLAIDSGVDDFAKAGQAYYRQNPNRPAVNFAPGADWLYPDRPSPLLLQLGGPFPVGLLLEEYLALVKMPPGGEGGHGLGTGDCGSAAGGPPRDYEEPPPTGQEPPGAGGVTEAEARVLGRAVAEAARDHAARHPGTLPGGLQAWAEYVLAPPQVPWSRKLRAALRRAARVAAGKTDYTYRRRSRRQPRRDHPRGRFVLPGMQTHTPKFGVVLDTSGSMTDGDYRRGLSEFAAALKVLREPRGVPTVCCDTRAGAVRLVRDVRRFLLEGGGGTDLGAGLAAAAELGLDLVAVFTDGFTNWPEHKPAGLGHVIVCVSQPPDASYPTPAWAEVFHVDAD